MKKILYITLVFLAIFLLPTTALAQTACTSNSAPSVDLCNGLGNVTTYQGVAGIFFAYLGSIIALLAIIMVVYSGFRMVLSAGDPESLKIAKAGFTYAIIGFIIAALSFVIVIAFQNFLGINTDIQEGSGQFTSPFGSSDFKTLMESVLRNAVALVGFLAIMMILYNAYMYISAGGNDEQLKKAKSGLLWSVVGFLTTILAYVLILAVYNLLS